MGYAFQWKTLRPWRRRDLRISMFSLLPPKKSTSLWPTKGTSMHLNIDFVLIRKITPSIISIFSPSVTIVYMAFVSFWIDPLAVPGRVTIIVTSLLAIITQLLSLREATAPVSYVTALDIWFFTCLTLVSLTLFEFAISYTMASRESSRIPRNLINQPSYPGIQRAISIFTGHENEFKKKLARISSNIDKFSRIFFPLIFVLFKILYFALFALKK